MLLGVLLPVAIGVTCAAADTRANGLVPVGPGAIAATLEPRLVPELPDRVRRIGVDPAGESHALVDAAGHVARRQVDDAAERRRAIEGRASPLEDIDALDLIDRHEIPVDAAAIALIHRHPVHEEQYARVEALHISCRAPDVDLAVQELNGGHFVHGLVDRVHGSPIDLLFTHLRNTRHGVITEAGQFRADDIQRRQLERRSLEREVGGRGIAARE